MGCLQSTAPERLENKEVQKRAARIFLGRGCRKDEDILGKLGAGVRRMEGWELECADWRQAGGRE